MWDWQKLSVQISYNPYNDVSKGTARINNFLVYTFICKLAHLKKPCIVAFVALHKFLHAQNVRIFKLSFKKEAEKLKYFLPFKLWVKWQMAVHYVLGKKPLFRKKVKIIETIFFISIFKQRNKPCRYFQRQIATNYVKEIFPAIFLIIRIFSLFYVYISIHNETNLNSKAETKSSRLSLVVVAVATDILQLTIHKLLKDILILLLLAVFIIMSWGQNKHTKALFTGFSLLLIILCSSSSLCLLVMLDYCLKPISSSSLQA